MTPTSTSISPPRASPLFAPTSADVLRAWGCRDDVTYLKATLEPRDLAASNRAWPWTANEGQTPPPGEHWRTWLFLGGRGAGKTRAGAEWLSALARADGGARLALVGPTLHDVREVMIEGPSGLRAIASDEARPDYEASRRRLRWKNGATAYAFSAEDPESLRGPQFAAAWADEFCAWRRHSETLALLRMGLRRGKAPRLCVTTTPRPIAALRILMAEATTVETRAATAANAANLSPGFLENLHALYGGTRLAVQELEGRVVEAADGALWRAEDLARCRGAPPTRFDRVVVAVDPPASATGDACGIVAAGRCDGRGYVLADCTVHGRSPAGWASAAVEAATRFRADAVVAEVNQGGDMVRHTLAVAGCPVPIRLVHATRSKAARAAPVAALYEQGRIVHAGAFPALEEEMMGLGSSEHGPSPDRADALVWALTDLMLGHTPAPRLRAL